MAAIVLLAACATQQDVSLVRQTEAAATQIGSGSARPSTYLSLGILAETLWHRLTRPPPPPPRGLEFRPAP